tara:strand:+ start:95 stop:247 length:153 start_codon:yes stop_codon:yes gene_type:complete
VAVVAVVGQEHILMRLHKLVAMVALVVVLIKRLQEMVYQDKAMVEQDTTP